MSQKAPDAPRFWIVAGPNGSGKSSLYDSADIEGFGPSVWIINPDLLSARLGRQEQLSPLSANAEALDRIWAWLVASLRAHQTVGVETVLSTGKYRELVVMAKSFGFRFHLIYVLLRNVEDNIERVRIRVAKGGHFVAEDKIRLRRERSLQQLPWFLAQADAASIYDNSGAAPALIAQKRQNLFEVDFDAPPEIIDAITAVPG